MHNIDLSNFGTVDVKCTCHVAAIAKGLQKFSSGSLIDEDVDVDMWGYHLYSEWPYVANMGSFTDDELEACRLRYMMHAGALGRVSAIIMAQLRYIGRYDSMYWNCQIPWERRTLYVLGRFVPYHLQCCYNLNGDFAGPFIGSHSSALRSPLCMPMVPIRAGTSVYGQIQYVSE